MYANVAHSLGVPLNGEDERLLRVLDRLDRSVRRPCTGAQTGTEAVHRLVVERIDIQLRRAEYRGQRAPGATTTG